MIRTAFLLLALGAAPALAEEPAAAAPAPAVAPADAPRAEMAPAPVSLASTPNRPIHWGLQYSAGVAAAVVAVPISVYLGAWLGSLSNNLIWAALPALLCFGLIPPLAVTFATWLAGNWNSKGTYSFWLPALATFVVNALGFVIAGFAGVTVGVVSRVVAFTIAEALVLPAVSTGTMRLTAKPTDPQPLTMRDPVSGGGWMVPMSEVSF